VTETSKVVSIHGGTIEPRVIVKPDVVAELERALEAARAGEIVGIAVVYNHADECTSASLLGRTSRGMLGLLAVHQADLVDAIRQGRDE
jgi:hypothetical protein